MEWALEGVLIQATLIIATIAGLLYSYITRNYNYWKQKGIPHEEPTFPFGNGQDLVLARKHLGAFYETFYKKFKKNKYGGIYEVRKPTLIVTDLDIVKQILTKDFYHFMDRPLPPKSSHDFLANHLFAMEGKEWKEMRTKLTPTFTSGRMKQMFTLIEKCSEQLKKHLEPLALNDETIDVKDLTSRFTLDIISTCAFGLDVNTLQDSNADIFDISQLIFRQSKWKNVKRFFMSTFPVTANVFGMSLTDDRVKDFLLKLTETTVKYREENNVSRNDFMDLLIKVKNNASLDDDSHAQNKNHGFKENALTLKEMAAQAFVFFAAGFETASSTTTFVLYELARNPDLQEKLRREIDEVLENNDGKITYQAIQEMNYMEQVLNETLRMYASVPALIRKCTEPYKIPDKNVTLDLNVKVVIPSYAIHHDPDIYPEPFKFDPERFSEVNIRSRHNYSFLPFGEGPRVCIGMRFGKMQVKAGLSTIISNYELSITPETPIPLEITPNSIVTASVKPIKLRFSKRSS
ncbi:probable cytochrome P450 6a14 [Macrosteles quadrilineatus]|uniref:probable cytochrome P450 6a14 n=1 Tax=Macrosteles quadrilineatus TaxID=74068 RepID=UPI0023E24C67|nr:probable cytochrome P450 6a14 [Macrosteles quadrilineatus]